MRGAVTRFAARDDGPAARLVGFMAHLRASGFKLGVRTLSYFVVDYMGMEK